MNAHLSAELLSALLDGELAERRKAAAEDHLVGCPVCRYELARLFRVVDVLQRLERQAPPPVLGQLVSRRVALEGRREDLGARLDRRLQALPLAPSLSASIAIVLFFAVILVLFADAVARRKTGLTRVVLDVPSIESAAELERLHDGTIVALGDRHLQLEGGIWWQIGVPRQRPDRVVFWDSSPAGELLAAEPSLAALASLTAPVVLEVSGQPVELWSAGASGSG